MYDWVAFVKWFILLNKKIFMTIPPTHLTHTLCPKPIDSLPSPFKLAENLQLSPLYLCPSISSTSNLPTLIKLSSLSIYLFHHLLFTVSADTRRSDIWPSHILASWSNLACSNLLLQSDSLVVSLHLANHDLASHLHHHLCHLFSLSYLCFPCRRFLECTPITYHDCQRKGYCRWFSCWPPLILTCRRQVAGISWDYKPCIHLYITFILK